MSNSKYDKKNRILGTIEQFKTGLNLYQIGNMFFPKNEHNYHYTRIKMRKLELQGEVSSYFNFPTNKKYYYIPMECSKDIKVSTSREKLLDFYSLLIYHNCRIIDYKFEYEWSTKRYRSDGIFYIEYNKNRYILVCEIDDENMTRLKKYDNIYESNEWQDKFGVFPLIFIVNRTGYKYKQSTIVEDFLTYMDFNLSDFNMKVITKLQ